MRVMRGELKSLDSVDAPAGLEAFEPSDAQSFALAVAATVGPEAREGGDLFYFTVCTAGWHEIAAKLRLYGDWEFEGYREAT